MRGLIIKTSLLLGMLACQTPARADDLVYSYDCDVAPYHPSAGWSYPACDPPCSESLAGGHFILTWVGYGRPAGYAYPISPPLPAAPTPLWVEWQYRSDHIMNPFSYSCDGRLVVRHGAIGEVINMYGNAAVSFSGDDAILGLDLESFHTYRFESWDGHRYQVSVDGQVFIDNVGGDSLQHHLISFGGRGGCGGDQPPVVVNEWDFIRFGSLGTGESIVASDPPAGLLDARDAPLDRFTVTFDEPNYVYVDEINVESTGTSVPQVMATTRRDNGPPDEVEIVLDGPVPYRATTRFTFDDGTAVNVVEFTFAPGDTDGDGDADLADFSYLQNCTGGSDEGAEPRGDAGFAGPCLALDADADSAIDLPDHADFLAHFAGP